MINKVVKSLKGFPLNGYLIIIIMSLYCLNRFYFKTHSSGWINYILCCHFNDVLCGTLFIAYSNVFLNTRNLAMVRLHSIIPFCFCAGLVWEFIAPIIRPGSVSDWIDVGCYVLGGIIYFSVNKIWLFLRKLK